MTRALGNNRLRVHLCNATFERDPLSLCILVHCTMSSLRFARSALRARPSLFSAPFQRRGYAEAVPDKIKLSLTLPHQVRQANSDLTYLSR